ncbi:MAG: YdiU family protein [Desulfofustis sp.]|nr:YdiU family protein [Desulfofustis sp.]
MQTSVTDQYEATLSFENQFADNLPGDQDRNNTRRQVSGACYSFVDPTPVSAPVLVAYSKEAAAELGLSEENCRAPWFTDMFSGNLILGDMKPYAMCYGGHQFGTWAGQLGDGRAINLGEVVNGDNQRWTLQLKGAGPTPYSRSADGLAVLRSSLREFICSEAMHHLGIPTTRALSLILTGDRVLRDMFYDGHPELEPGAVVCRTSPSFIRFGNFEILSARQEYDLLEQLLHFTVTNDFPEIDASGGVDSYLQWFTEVSRRTASMIAHWMRVGFVHGVMNSDNMSVLGLTIDYGPYGWLEGYDPTWTPNTTDAQGRRYCYGNQPYMAQWNLMQLANAIFPVVKDEKRLQEALDSYRVTFQEEWQQTLRAKLGLHTLEKHDDKMISSLLELFTKTETDMTIFFRSLANLKVAEKDGDKLLKFVEDAFYTPEEISQDHLENLKNWLHLYRLRLLRNDLGDEERRRRMNQINPKYVFRNYLAQQAIDKVEEGDYSKVEELLDLFRKPYDEQPERHHYAAKRPEWARNRPGCSMLSCSS